MKFKESGKVELKKSTAELKAALNDLCAFANSGIGTIYFGISDKGKVIGQDISDSTLKKVSTTILSLIEPRLYPNVYTETADGKGILVVELKNSAEKPYFYKGKAYKRVGTSNAYLSRYEVEKYLYERENPAYRFDKTIVKEYSEDIDQKTLKWFLRKAQEERNLPVDLRKNRTVTLAKLGLLTQSKLNFAGIVSFGKQIQRYFPDVIVKCAVFEGIDKTGRILDHIEIKDNIFQQIDSAERFVLRNLRKSAWISQETGRRHERYELPYLAIREAVANAVAHRDYRIPSHIDVAIFDDRVEIWSPGELPLGVKLKDIIKKRVSVLRNPGIAEVLFLAGYIERWGTGIKKMNRLMKEYELNIPDYEEVSGNFLVTFKKKGILVEKRLETESVPSLSQVCPKSVPSDIAVKILNKAVSEVSITELMKAVSQTNRTRFRNQMLRPLIKAGLIYMTIPDNPQSSNQKYVTTKKGKELSK